MRIALITDWFPPRIGGVEHQVYDLARELAARGHAVHVLTTARGESPALPGVTVHRFHYAMVPGSDVAVPNFFRLPQLRRALRDVSVDVVHGHGMLSIFAIGGIVAAHRLGIPTVFTLRSRIPDAGRRAAARLAFFGWARKATIVTAISAAVADDARRVSGRRHVRVIHNGLSLDDDCVQRDKGSSPQPSPPPLHVVSVMRLANTKHPAELIRAVPRILAGCRRPVRFTILGGGPLLPALRDQARELGVDSAVTFRGACSRDQVSETLRSGDLFMLPTRNEGLGNAALEARRSGLAIVAMNSGGIVEVVEHGVNGLLANSHGEFVNHAIQLLNDDALRHALASRSRNGLERFAWESVVAQYVAVYEEALQSASPTRVRQQPANGPPLVANNPSHGGRS